MINKQIVVKAMDELFHQKDEMAIDRYWHESYVQHRPSMTNGHLGLRIC